MHTIAAVVAILTAVKLAVEVDNALGKPAKKMWLLIISRRHPSSVSTFGNDGPCGGYDDDLYGGLDGFGKNGLYGGR
jgi:hypothetical protein